MTHELIKRRAGEYKVKGTMKGAPLSGDIVRVSDGGKTPWHWLVGYRLDPRDRGTWRRGYCKTLAEAKNGLSEAISRMKVTDYKPDSRA